VSSGPNATIQCPTGRIAVGGGYSFTGGTVQTSAPVNAAGAQAIADETPTGWMAKASANASSSNKLTVYVICAG
jgi:hypothetical protein